MLKTRDKTGVVNIAELKVKFDTLPKMMKGSHIVLWKRRKPIAVLMPFEHYTAMKELLEFAEDTLLGGLAHDREKRSTKKDYLPMETVKRKIGLK